MVLYAHPRCHDVLKKYEGGLVGVTDVLLVKLGEVLDLDAVGDHDHANFGRGVLGMVFVN